MPIIDLPEDRWYQMQRYAKGEAVEVPQELHDLITLERESRRTNGRELLLRTHNEKTVDALQAAGFLHPDDVFNATPEELQQIPGFGPATAKKIKGGGDAQPE